MKKFLLLGCFITSLHFAFATTGKTTEPCVSGTVVDASTKKPVQDVTITATHTVTKAEQIVTTDASGQYKLNRLEKGAYKLKFQKNNYKSVEKNNVTVKAETPLKLNVEIDDNDNGGDVEDYKHWDYKFGM